MVARPGVVQASRKGSGTGARAGRDKPVPCNHPFSDSWTAWARLTVRGSSSPTICILFMT